MSSPIPKLTNKILIYAQLKKIFKAINDFGEIRAE